MVLAKHALKRDRLLIHTPNVVRHPPAIASRLGEIHAGQKPKLMGSIGAARVICQAKLLNVRTRPVGKNRARSADKPPVGRQLAVRMSPKTKKFSDLAVVGQPAPADRRCYRGERPSRGPERAINAPVRLALTTRR